MVVSAGVLALCLVLIASLAPLSRAQDTGEPLVIVVTNAGDSIVEGESECPSDTLCTLRRAIELANETPADPDAIEEPPPLPGEEPAEDEEPAAFRALTITFDPTVFPAGAPVAIEVEGEPLPALVRENTHIDGSGAGVIVEGSLLVDADQTGLRFGGDSQSLRGLAIEHFTGTCLEVLGDEFEVGGDPALGFDVKIGDCTTGIVLAGTGSRVNGVSLGVGADLAVATAIHVLGSDATIGDDGEEHPWPNTIAQAVTGVRVGDGAVVTDNTRIAGNTFGVAPGDDDAASVTFGVVIQAPATGSVVRANTFAHVLDTAIVVGPPAGLLANDGHTFSQNTFGAPGEAIDLNANSLRDANDAGDIDGGANGTLNHPAFSKATLSNVQGSAGATCAGCTVEIYRADHAPGGANDLPEAPLATVLTDSNGTFSMTVPGLAEDDWLTATATDAAGNTSEFGPSARVGTGLVQCGATQLVNGWNHAGFFGPNGTTLGERFPASGPEAGRVLAVYKLVDGTSTFLHWAAGMPFGNTLLTLEPGESYFFLADGEVSLPGGFALNVSYPVALQRGWNDFVYIGGEGHYLDAFGAANAVVPNTYRFAPGGSGSMWEQTGPAGTPAWARDFTGITSCATFEVFATGAATLTPLQP